MLANKNGRNQIALDKLQMLRLKKEIEVYVEGLVSTLLQSYDDKISKLQKQIDHMCKK